SLLRESLRVSATDPATTESYPLSLHDALPISGDTDMEAWAASLSQSSDSELTEQVTLFSSTTFISNLTTEPFSADLLEIPSSLRSEEHTSELQSRENLVCRLLLEKKKKNEDNFMLIIEISAMKHDNNIRYRNYKKIYMYKLCTNKAY